MASEKFKKHMGRPVQFPITGEDDNGEKVTDIFEFRPLNVEEFTTLMVLGDKFKDADKTGKNITREDADELMKLYVSIVKRSFPEEEDNDVENFVVHNFALLPDLMKKLSPSNLDEKQKKGLDKIRELQKRGQIPQPGQSAQK